MAITYIGAQSVQEKEIMCMNADVATLPVTGVANGSALHVIDTGVYGTFFGTHWYNLAGGAVIV